MLICKDTWSRWLLGSELILVQSRVHRVGGNTARSREAEGVAGSHPFTVVVGYSSIAVGQEHHSL